MDAEDERVQGSNSSIAEMILRFDLLCKAPWSNRRISISVHAWLPVI
jgi:hypothetical protein